MSRALLAWILAIFAVSAAVAVESRAAFAVDTGLFAAKFDPSAVPPQGEDQADFEKQPCFSSRDWNGKAAAKVLSAAFRCNRVPVPAKVGPPPQSFEKPIVFLHACAPRAPPLFFRV